MARQPVLDRSGQVYGYEVLYRASEGSTSGGGDPSGDAKVLVDTLVDVGLARLAGSKLAFINVPAMLLHSEDLLRLPKDRVVLELSETLEMSPMVKARLKELRSLGYTLAYDEFVFEGRQFKFVPYVQYVKVNMLDCPAETIRAELPELKRFRTGLLAQKVEDKVIHRRCMSWGFDYFQGRFYARPELVSSKPIAPRHELMLTLVAKLQDPETSFDQIEQLVEQEGNFTVRLLRLVNSAAWGAVGVTSVRVALGLIGLEKLRDIATFLALAGDSEESSELLSTGLMRARMCEQMSMMTREGNPETCFMAGLFSILDAMLDLPMSVIVKSLPLDDELSAALVDPNIDNSIGRVLRRTLAYAHGDWDAATKSIDNPSQLGKIYIDSATWARRLEAEVYAA